ncbi:uncharacterized protein LOC130713789 [Lotus japonicus]|uniref:uncharacterized protein LOC130713789 n=1 Tax=Lotus japonicus TaxID=34305 RepID=UPI00258A4A60|nr:uncharacterized protein LOC130713789 [Lotus japonicus]
MSASATRRSLRLMNKTKTMSASATRRSLRLMNKTHTSKKQNRNPADADHQFIDLSLSDSPSSQNIESESWKCPPSVRKHLIPDSVMISARRTSLRSSKKPIETEKAAISACSKPQASRELFSSTNVFQQQLNHPSTLAPEKRHEELEHVGFPVAPVNLTANVPEMEQVPEVEMSISNPSTLAPEKRHEELENVGNSVAPVNLTANVPDMEQVPEVEMSIPNPSNQMEGKNTFQASNNFGGIAKKNLSKSFSVGSPSGSCSLNITEMVNMWDDDEDDEVDCDEHSDTTVGGYKVKPESRPILRKILSKHGDIARNCTVLTMTHRSLLLELICDIISELQGMNLGRIKEYDLNNMIALVNDIKNVEVDIEWLHLRLVEILEAIQLVHQSGTLKEKKEINRKFIEIVESKLEECENQKKEVRAQLRSLYDKETETKERLARAMDESTRIMASIKDAKTKVKRFLHRSMVDGLI